MKMAMKFEGGEALRQRLDALAGLKQRRVSLVALRAGAEPIRDAVSEYAPREPGTPDLAENINVWTVRQTEARGGDDEHGVAIGVPKSFFYDWFLEYGTVDIGPHPFYRPALDERHGMALEEIRQTYWTEITRLATSGRSSPSGGLL